MPVVVRVLSQPDVAARSTELQATYEAMYGVAPGDAPGVGPLLQEHGRREGFRLVAALDGDRMIGFAYGFTGGPGQPWRDDMARAVGAELAAEWLTGHFEFAEFGVVPSMRRRGVGTMLYDRVFAGLAHDRAVLTVREDNVPARSFYEGRGWRSLHEGFVAEAGHGPYAIMGAVL